jgi:hypothetical protein
MTTFKNKEDQCQVEARKRTAPREQRGKRKRSDEAALNQTQDTQQKHAVIVGLGREYEVAAEIQHPPSVEPVEAHHAVPRQIAGGEIARQSEQNQRAAAPNETDKAELPRGSVQTDEGSIKANGDQNGEDSCRQTKQIESQARV